MLAIIAVFKDAIKNLIWRPRLKTTIELCPPDCHKTYAGPVTTYYYLFKVWNNGRVAARNVELVISDVFRDGERLTHFLPDNLKWSLISDPNGGAAIRYPVIPTGTFRYCNLGHIYDPTNKNCPDRSNPYDPNAQLNPKVFFEFDLFFESNMRYFIVPAGTYTFSIDLFCENGTPKRQKYQMVVTGQWSAIEEKMLATGISIKEL